MGDEVLADVLNDDSEALMLNFSSGAFPISYVLLAIVFAAL